VSADPGEVVERYLALCQARELEEAGALLVEGATIVFPGGVRHADLPALVSDARSRYERIAKRREPPLVAPLGDGRTLVLSRGTLHGVGLDGRVFSDVRYVDIFVVEDGLIVEQHVFNDLAELGIVGAAAGQDPETR
jgi:hypothetical protein